MNPRRLHRRDRPTGSRPTDVVDASMLARLDAEGSTRPWPDGARRPAAWGEGVTLSRGLWRALTRTNTGGNGGLW